jgi:flagellar biosynthesis protein FlhA
MNAELPFRPGGEIPLAAVFIGILIVILVPLPPALMDALLILNFTLSLMILMTATSVSRPIDISVFPSLLLVVTFFRLALNIATTRLILGNAEKGLAAAGAVIQAFGQFVAGSNVVVGFIVFLIIMIVQFVVITKGSTRISEVAARFTLDAMPGKQLSIDGDLAAGFIDEQTARLRRKEISEAADFYGAMDGASKFVRGEAMAGLFITLLNIAGGFCIGLIYHGMSVKNAAEVFTRLTIGDGLVNQIPALMVSVAAALLITKSTGGKSLAGDLGRQLFRNDQVFFIAAGFLLLLLGSGLPKDALLFAALVCAGAGFLLRGRVRREAENQLPAGSTKAESPRASVAEGTEERARSLLAIEPVELEIGYRLVGLVDDRKGGDIMARLLKVRERIALDLGFVVPPVKVRDNIRLASAEYSIKLRGNVMGRWRLWPGRVFVSAGGETLDGIQGVEGKDPASGRPGLWVEENQWSSAASAGYSVRLPAEIIASHLETNVRQHAAEILTRDEVSRLIADLRERAPALVGELIPDKLRMGEVHKVLQNLLREEVSIRDLETILETLADHSDKVRDPAVLTERVRKALSRSICSSLAGAAGSGGVLRAALLDPALEEFLETSLEEAGQGKRLALEPEIAATLAENAREALERLAASGAKPVLVCSGSLRAHVRNLIVSKAPSAAVLAYEEVSQDFHLEARESVALQAVG